MKVEIGDYDKINGTSDLKCPGCGETTGLHHDRVEVYERAEDATSGVHVVVDNMQATMDTNLQDNPSARRHGLAIRFWCEHCDGKHVLALAQHKGMTYISWHPAK